MKSKNKIKNSLKKHLINFGLQFFNSFDQYDYWKEKYFKKSNISDDTKKKIFKIFRKKLNQ